MPHSKLAMFNQQTIRRTFYNNEWWFSVVDVVGALTKSSIARRYWSDLKRQLAEKEGFGQLYEKIVQLKLSKD
jgi:DNA-damage-inducible protein D